MIALRVTRRPGATQPDASALALPPEGLTIGRAVDCGLVLADPLRVVSRQHAQVLAVDGNAARVRCLSGSSPLWVNDVPVDAGGERPLAPGDRLRIGAFELAVEPAPAAAAAPRSRLARWFDLDGAPDPLGDASPLPALILPFEPPAPAPTPMPVPALQAARRRPAATPARAAAARPSAASAELRELAAAFGRGAGLAGPLPPLTPEWMQHVGALLRTTAEGTHALLQSRAVTKRHMRAEGTHIAPRQNNPLKFSPDAGEALVRLLQPEASPGFLDPVAALHDAHRDLLVHQVSMVAGMRAAVFELFSRLGPDAVEHAEGPPHGWSRLPVVRAAALWRRHRDQHARMLEHLDDDFDTVFGREFLRAYEAQSRADAEAEARPGVPEGG